MTKQEYLDEVCKLVSKAATEAGGLDKALDWLHDAEDLVSHPWLDEKKKVMQILQLSPNWNSYFFCIQNGCIGDIEHDAEDIHQMLENLACSAMFADCEEIIERVLQADERIKKAMEHLAQVSKDLGFKVEIDKARREFENRTPYKVEVNVTEEEETLGAEICPRCGGIRPPDDAACPPCEEEDEAVREEENRPTN
jgi:hypothetical protein